MPIGFVCSPLPGMSRARGPVEQWLGSVESAMFDTVKRFVILFLNVVNYKLTTGSYFIWKGREFHEVVINGDFIVYIHMRYELPSTALTKT